MSSPTPERFSNSFWVLGDVLGWIADRDPPKFGCIVSIHDLPPPIFRDKLGPPEDEPEQELLRALQDGDLVAYDPAKAGQDSRINPDFWLFKNGGDIRALIERRLSFRRNDVLRVWPELNEHFTTLGAKPSGQAGASVAACSAGTSFEPPPEPEATEAVPQRASSAQQATDASATSNAPRLAERILDRHPRDAVPIPNKPGGGGHKKAAAIAAMIKAVEDGDLSFAELRRMKQKQLSDLYPHAKRTMLQEARVQALSQLADLGYSDKAPT